MIPMRTIMREMTPMQMILLKEKEEGGAFCMMGMISISDAFSQCLTIPLTCPSPTTQTTLFFSSKELL